MVGWWWYPALGVVALAVAALLVAHVPAARGADRAASGAHALMAVAMAGMFWPAVDVLPAPAGALVFGLLGAWFAAVRLRRGSRVGPGVDEPTHLAVGSVAMVVMYLGLPGAGSTGDGGHAGHAAHGGSAAAGGPGWLLVVVVGLALVGYFVWHAWETLAVEHPSAPATPTRTGVLTGTRTLTAAHVTLDALMAVMFLGAL